MCKELTPILATKSEKAEFVSFPLTESVRNSGAIFSLALSLYDATGQFPPLAPLYRGPAVDWKVISSDGDIGGRLKQALIALNKWSASQIAVITTGDWRVRDRLFNDTILPLVQVFKVIWNVELSSDVKSHSLQRCGEDELCIDTVHNFQGADRDAIILIVPASTIAKEHALYIGITRAVGLLIIICTQSTREKIAFNSNALILQPTPAILANSKRTHTV